ncbi:MAG: histidine triad nucleotide-binding protein [Candidatus Omnitrophica bacterium CG11_big_fil_rev_8_21_14_0_20_63_9]|nr:MAG: histidine triad nucleotide-binding protein [Candidatus Omnitrophica bacterium CG11_big_fil_rev_8_21_14_0_20_63_9]
MSDGGCLFCRIAKRTVPSDIVGEADGLLAFRDIHPQAPTHLLIIPTEHVPSLADVSGAHTTLLGNAMQFANRLARQYQLGSGYRIVVNSGAQAGQSVWHLHFHLLGGRAFQWPPG